MPYQQASFNGVPFAVLVESGSFGRRQSVHEYPYRDLVWAEDLGRRARRFTFSGFLIEDSLVYGGGDVLAQRARMIAAVEKPGNGLLIHPTLGRMSVSVDNFSSSIRWDQNRVCELGFSFCESGAATFPAVDNATQDNVTRQAAAANAAAAQAYAARMSPALAMGAIVGAQARAAVGAFSLRMNAAAGDAGAAFGLHVQLSAQANLSGGLNITSSFGRYAGGRSVGFATVSAAGSAGLSLSGGASFGLTGGAALALSVNAGAGFNAGIAAAGVRANVQAQIGFQQLVAAVRL